MQNTEDDTEIITIGNKRFWPAALTAQKLHVTPLTLRRWANLGSGPPRTKLGKRVFYEETATVNWMMRPITKAEKAG